MGTDMGGFAQTGGPVLTDRFGNSLSSPLIPHRRTDVLVATTAYSQILLGLIPTNVPSFGEPLLILKNNVLYTDFTLSGPLITLGSAVTIGDVFTISTVSFRSTATAPSWFGHPPNVLSLLHMDTAFTDAVAGASWSASYFVSIGTTKKKFGAGAFSSIDAIGQNATGTIPGLSTLGTNDFTVELWGYIETSGNRMLLDIGGQVKIICYGGTTCTFYIGSNTRSITIPTTGVWGHFAISRASGVVRCFYEGTKAGTDLPDTTNITSGTVAIGSDNGSYSTFLAIDEFRFTANSALYTSNFTPPAGPFTYP